VVLGHFPAGFYGVEFWRVRWDVFHANAWSIFCNEIFHALCFVKSCVVEDKDVLFFPVEFPEEFSQEMTECQTVLRDVKIIEELVIAGECAEGDELFSAPEECSSWCFSSGKPNLFVCCCEFEAGFINGYDFMTQILCLKFFLKSRRNSSTFFGSFLICWGLGVILEKSSL